MTILLVIHHHLEPDTGAPGATLFLGSAYAEAGSSVSYYAFDALPAWWPERLRMLLFPLCAAFAIQRRVRAGRIDVIDASAGDTWLWATVFRPFLANPPLLVTRSHGLEHLFHFAHLEEQRSGRKKLSWKYPLYSGGWRLHEVAMSFRRADLALFLNEGELQYAVNSIGVAPGRARIVTNGVPDEFLDTDPGGWDDGGRDGAIGIAQVGAFRYMKGVDHSIEALNSILSRHRLAHASFLGTTCPPDEVLNRMDPSVRGRVRVVPRYERLKLPELLLGHQIKLFPTFSEGSSMALMESMACGLVPVTTPVVGVTDLVVDGANGLVVERADSRAVEEALERLMLDPALRGRLRRAARETVRERGWKNVSRHTLALYEEARAARR